MFVFAVSTQAVNFINFKRSEIVSNEIKFLNKRSLVQFKAANCTITPVTDK